MRTANNQLSCILNHAERFYGLQNNPCRIAGAIGTKYSEEMKFWKKEEFEKFLEVVSNKPASGLAFQLLFWTGMRIGEMLALTTDDIDLEERTIINH